MPTFFPLEVSRICKKRKTNKTRQKIKTKPKKLQKMVPFIFSFSSSAFSFEGKVLVVF